MSKLISFSTLGALIFPYYTDPLHFLSIVLKNTEFSWFVFYCKLKPPNFCGRQKMHLNNKAC